MTHLSGKSRSNYVKHLFARIAGRYDIVNRWISWGQDARWHQEALRVAALPRGGKLLDVGTGTGDFAFGARHKDKSAFVVGIDFTPEMMRQAIARQQDRSIYWLNADAMEIPFTAESFDAIVSGYLIRNVSDLPKALAEQYRVLKRGGHLVCLDTTPLPADVWHLPARFYVRYIMPIIGRLIASDQSAYTYLLMSTEGFRTAEDIAKCLQDVGLTTVQFRRLMGGTIAIHSGVK